MGATHKAFSDYLDVDLPRDKRVNNIIVTQACRHVIVHSGGRVSERLIKQISSATPRALKLDLKLDTIVQFSPEEVAEAAAEMRAYIDVLAGKVSAAVRAVS